MCFSTGKDCISKHRTCETFIRIHPDGMRSNSVPKTVFPLIHNLFFFFFLFKCDPMHICVLDLYLAPFLLSWDTIRRNEKSLVRVEMHQTVVRCQTCSEELMQNVTEPAEPYLTAQYVFLIFLISYISLYLHLHPVRLGSGLNLLHFAAIYSTNMSTSAYLYTVIEEAGCSAVCSPLEGLHWPVQRKPLSPVL